MRLTEKKQTLQIWSHCPPKSAFEHLKISHPTIFITLIAVCTGFNETYTFLAYACKNGKPLRFAMQFGNNIKCIEI